MPINDNGEFVSRTQIQLKLLLEDELRTEFGVDVDLTESSVFSNLVTMLSTVLAENQEADLKEVYDSAFLETATGRNLERVVEILGITRVSAIKATGVATFSRNSPVTNTVTVQSNTIIQTDEENPVRFVTDDSITLPFYDGFEDGGITEYSQPVGSFTVASGDAYSGSQYLTSTTQTSAIYRTDLSTRQGDQLSSHMWLTNGNTDGSMLFGTQDEDNTYLLRVTNNSLSFEKAVGGTLTTIDDVTGVTIPEQEWVELQVDWGLTDASGAMQFTLRLLDNTGATVTEFNSSDDEYTNGGFGFFNDGTTETRYDAYASRGRSVNITASDGGVEGNVGANSIVVAPIFPSGVSSVTNEYPTGDVTLSDLNSETYTLGQDQETDEELRERTRDSLGGAGNATIDAIAAALINLQGVQSVSMFENNEETTDGQGRPPFSFEAVVFGGSNAEIIDTIGEKKGATARPTGGHVGTLASGQWTSDVTGDTFDIEFSRPTEVNVDITLDIVVNDTYIGNDDLRNRIVNYIGGTLADGSIATGLVVGEDVYLDQIEDVVVGPDDTGVIGIASISTTPASTTDANGLDIIDVASNEVATTDATDGSISITVTTV